MIRTTVLALVGGLIFVANAGAQQLIGGCSVFPIDNVWNTPVDTLPVRADSATLINTIGAGTGLHPDFGAGQWDGGPIGIPFITVPGSQTKYQASFLYASESDRGPYSVPLTAPIEGGSGSTGDRHAIALDKDNCILYELYNAYPDATGWSADSGAIFDLKSNALRADGWTSADAAGLPIVPGLVTYDEVASGEIKHAIRFTAPQTRKAYTWPARHYASSQTGAQYPRMGERFRLKASFDISSYPADVQVILRAMKKYGVILADNGSAWYISGAPDSRWNDDNLSRLSGVKGSNFEAIDESGLMIDPNSGAAKQSTTTVVSVAVSPTTAALKTGQTQAFSASVSGSSNTAVTWSVNGIAGGNASVGTVSVTGLYTAPATVPSPNTVTVRATSAASASASASAAVTISQVVAAAPTIIAVNPVSVPTGAFTLTMTGTGFVNGSVVTFDGAALSTTFVSATSVKASGSAATPKTVAVTVRNPDGSSSNSVSVTVTAQTQTVRVAISPTSTSLRIGRSRQFVATVTGSSNTAVTWRVNGIVGGNGTVGRISTSGYYTAPNSVPNPSTVTVSATSAADTTKSANASVQITRR